MSKKEVQVTMDMLLKMKPEMFVDFVKSQPIGFNLSLRNLLQVQYEQCKASKDALVNIVISKKISKEEKTELNKTIKDLYLCMQLLEDRFTLVNAWIKSHN